MSNNSAKAGRRVRLVGSRRPRAGRERPAPPGADGRVHQAGQAIGALAGQAERALELEGQVLELRKTGASFDAIARALGIGKTSALRARDRALARLRQESLIEARDALALQLARYEDLLVRTERLLRAEPVVRPDGTAVVDERGNALTRLPDADTYAKGLAVRRSVLESIDRLLGLGGVAAAEPPPADDGEDVLVIEVRAGRRLVVKADRGRGKALDGGA